MQNANTVKFTGGLTLDDLEISMTQGYDKSGIDHIPSDSEFIITPRLNGDTWNISIKGTNDVPDYQKPVRYLRRNQRIPV